jgi:hypothetical protein
VRGPTLRTLTAVAKRLAEEGASTAARVHAQLPAGARGATPGGSTSSAAAAAGSTATTVASGAVTSSAAIAATATNGRTPSTAGGARAATSSGDSGAAVAPPLTRVSRVGRAPTPEHRDADDEHRRPDVKTRFNAHQLHIPVCASWARARCRSQSLL